MLKRTRFLVVAGLLAGGIGLTGVGPGGSAARALADTSSSTTGVGPLCAQYMSYLESLGYTFGPNKQGQCASAFYNTQSSSSAGTVSSCASYWVPAGVFPNQGDCVAYWVYNFKTH